MELVPILFGIACAVSYWLAALSRDRDARLIAASLGAMWGLANAAWLANMLALLPVLDLWLGIVALTIWWATRAKWVALIVDAVAVRLVLHVLDFMTGHLFIVAYLHALNATFAWMLVVVASSGGGYVRDILLRRIRGFRGALSPASPGGMRHGR